MGNNFDDVQLMTYLLKFVCGIPIQCHQFRIVDLYGNNKPSQLFDTTTNTTVNYVFTQLKKKKTGNGKNINRGIIGGGGSWKGVDSSKPVYDRKQLVIGLKKTFRFDEGIHVWNMKEYSFTDKSLASLARRQIRHGDFVLCRITRSSNSSHGGDNFVTYNQELGRSNADMSQVSNATQLPLMISTEEERYVPMVYQETPSVSRNDDIARYHRELDAYAATILEFNTNPLLVPYVPQDEDQCPLFCEDFYIGHTALWG